MAKRRKAPQRREVEAYRAAATPVQRRKPPRRPAPRTNRTPFLLGGAVAVGVAVIAAAFVSGLIPGFGPGATPSPSRPAGPFQPPTATPLANPPAEPAGDGTTVTIETELGNIVIQLFNQSSPVAAQNVANLAEAGFYNGVGFHRIVPGFVIQGGDPEGTGGGGPGYSIPDEPVVGTYGRGIVAMARTDAPNSQGSQFFIVLDDDAREALEFKNTYAIFGKVISGMEVADSIAATPNSGPPNNSALDPVLMTRVTVQRP
jgi:cyclophilin family peptidyl-prolyl cis-trans isomerase